MTKHKCGTCRFFQEARLAGSGWCHHPQRRTTNDVMIMVRRNELACRDEWAHDLWADAEGSGAVERVPTPIARLTARPEPAATAGEIAAVVQAQTASTDGKGDGRIHEDIVVGETSVIAEIERDREWRGEDDSAARVVDTRAAIIKARETYRDRTKSLPGTRAGERVPLGARDDAPAEVSPATAATHGEEGTSTVEGSVAPPPPDPSLRRIRPPSPAVSDGFDDVPAVLPGFEIPTIERRSGTADDEFDRFDVVPTGTGPPRPLKEEHGEVPSGAADEAPVGLAPVRMTEEAGQAAAGFARRHPERRPIEPSLVPVRMERVQVSSAEYRTERDVAGADLDLTEERREEATALIRGRRGPFRHDPPPVSVREVAERSGAFGGDETPPLVAEAEPDPAEPELSGPAEDVVLPTRTPDPGQTVDTTIRVAPDLPRICRMCRDYRPAEGGDRGWCANEWAFTHRRVVDPDERMPCETSLGSWWLPVDAIWLTSTDVSAHGQPTPILDAVVASHRVEPMQRRGS